MTGQGRVGYHPFVRDEKPTVVLPGAPACACGCGRLVVLRRRGRTPRFASGACREAARRRRKAGLPENLPRRTRAGGRRPFRRTPLTLDELRRHRKELLDKAESCGISAVRVFGSVARNDANLSSDLDLLIDIEPGTGILGPGAFYMDVWDLLEVQPDIVETAALTGQMRSRVLREAVPL